MPVPARRRESAASTVRFPETPRVGIPCVIDASKAICSPACPAKALSALVNVPAGTLSEMVVACWARATSIVENNAAPLKRTANSWVCLRMRGLAECVICPRTCPLKCGSAGLTDGNAILGQAGEKKLLAQDRQIRAEAGNPDADRICKGVQCRVGLLEIEASRDPSVGEI